MTEPLTQQTCVACRKGEPTVTDAEAAELHRQVPDWELIEVDGIKRLRRVFSADDFAQASAKGNAALFTEALRGIEPRKGLRVLELFAGSGNFTAGLVGAGCDVTWNDLVLNRVIARDLAGARFLPGPAHEAVAQVAGERFDVLLLDPPRTGAAEVVDAVRAMADPPARLVYVSCDAATLARDLERLCDAGYAPKQAQVLDLFPQTAHLEIVAIAER